MERRGAIRRFEGQDKARMLEFDPYEYTILYRGWWMVRSVLEIYGPVSFGTRA